MENFLSQNEVVQLSETTTMIFSHSHGTLKGSTLEQALDRVQAHIKEPPTANGPLEASVKGLM